MRHIIMAMLFLCLPIFAKTPLQIASEIETNIDSDTVNFPVLKQYADRAVNGALTIAIKELRKKGSYAFADEIEFEWTTYYGQSLFGDSYNIGDHTPISKWLEDKYNQIEFILGVDICKKLHISDIKTLNSGIKVVTHPCTFPMDLVSGERKVEYARHVNGGPTGDDIYYGIIPVITFWVIDLSCMGAGGSFVCGLAANLGERLINLVGNGISDRIYDRFCGSTFN